MKKELTPAELQEFRRLFERGGNRLGTTPRPAHAGKGKHGNHEYVHRKLHFNAQLDRVQLPIVMQTRV